LHQKAKSADDLINYGLFSWRKWLSVPLLAAVYRYRGRSDLAEALSSDPAEFARQNWTGRHPKLSWLTYSTSDPLGPRRILSVWTKVLKPLVRSRGGMNRAAQFGDNPVLFARNLKNPVLRLAGHLLFPMGEKQ
jgi:hypothetical protein